MNTLPLIKRQPALRHALIALPLLFAGLALIGAFRAYSAVPVADMWVSYLPFMDVASSVGWRAWWFQHNEHRLVLARLFFWADLRWFDGAGWFLIVVNYVLVALAAILFCRVLDKVETPPGRAGEKYALKLLAICALFFWCQFDNLTGGFQNQFFLAQLLPLAALYSMYRAQQGGAGSFALACLFGVLSVGTMANGVLALPFMTAYAALTRQGARRVATLALLAAVTLFAYFHDYVRPAEHGSLSQALLEHPLKVLVYVVNYLGSPFYFAFGGSGLGRTVADLAGLFMIASSARFALRFLRQPQQAALPLALLFYIAYIGGTAFGTASGRLIFGVSQAFTSRYTTPALMAWVALIVLYAPALLALQERQRRRTRGALLFLLMLMLVYQLRAVESKMEQLYHARVAALAVELRIRDKAEISYVFPDTGIIESAAQAVDRQRSVFGQYPYRGARVAMGAAFAQAPLPPCQGALERAVAIEDDPRFLRVSGWLVAPAGKAEVQVVRFLDGEGRQLGYALVGQARSDISAVAGKVARQAGYRGYLVAAAPGQTLTMRGEANGGPICRLQAKAPMAQHEQDK